MGLDDYAWVQKHPARALDLIRVIVKDKDSVFVFAVGHLSEKKAWSMYQSLEKASFETSLKVHAIDIKGEPAIVIEQEKIQ